MPGPPGRYRRSMMVTLAWPPPSHIVTRPYRPAGAVQGVQQGSQQPGAGGAERMAERDRAAAGVDPVQVGPGLPLPGQDHAGERLVDLHQVDLVQRHPGTPQRVRGRRDRRGEHHDRVVAAGGQVADPGPRAQPVLAHGPGRGDQQRGGSVGDLAGQRGGDHPAVTQRLERRHLFRRGVPARALVGRDLAVRHDLGVERSRVDRAGRPPVAGQRVALHLLAADPPLGGDHVGRAELGDLLGAVPLPPAGRPAERVVEAERLPGQHRRGDRDLAHVLHAARNHHVRGLAHHGLRGEMHRLLG